MVDAFICDEKEILGQVAEICAEIEKKAGAVFVPEYADAFTRLAQREYFWFNLDSTCINQIVADSLRHFNVELDSGDMLDLSKVFSHLIDFQCHFTASHSSGVAGTAGALASLYNFSKGSCQMMKVAGHLHDIGKLTIPPGILNKQGKLTAEEFNVIKKHPFWTYRALNNIKGLEEVNHWASLHHERIDSNGYPFRYKGAELPLGSRIIAVADVFTALTEDRPYRKRLQFEEVQALLQEMVANHSLDGGVVAMLFNNYQFIEESRSNEQADSERLYCDYYDSTKIKNKSSHYALESVGILPGSYEGNKCQLKFLS